MQKYARIGETNYVRNIEDQGKYHNGDKSAMLGDKLDQGRRMQLAQFTID